MHDMCDTRGIKANFMIMGNRWYCVFWWGLDGNVTVGEAYHGQDSFHGAYNQNNACQYEIYSE
jgi:hypothetical protein